MIGLARGGVMSESMSRSYRLAEKLSFIYDLQGKIDSILSFSMYFLTQFLKSERSSIFIFQPWNQQLTIFSSLDLTRHEIRIPRSRGVAGWVFENRKPVIINDAYADNRFYPDVDKLTGFHTNNMICTPLCDCTDRCLGTLQTLNKTCGAFTTDDLELLNLAARMVAIAISNNKRYRENLVTSEARRKVIGQMSDHMGQRSAPLLT